MNKAQYLLNLFSESIIDPVHKDLSPDLWTEDKKLKPEAKKAIMDFIDAFVKDNNLSPIRKILTGSICTYQYAPDSDVDINVSVDIDDKALKGFKDVVKEYNGKMLLETQHPMNLYILNKEWIPGFRGPSYDLEKDDWEVLPEKQLGKMTYRGVLELALSWARKIDLDIAELQRDLKEKEVFEYHLSIIDRLEGMKKEEVEEYLEHKNIEIRADIDTLKMNLYVIKLFRQKAFEGDLSDGDDIQWLTKTSGPNVNYSINNIIYKLLERFGYFNKLHDILDKFEGKV